MNNEYFDEFDDPEDFENWDPEDQEDEAPESPDYGFIRQASLTQQYRPEPDEFPEYPIPEPRSPRDEARIDTMLTLWEMGKRLQAMMLYGDIWRVFWKHKARVPRKKTSGTRRHNTRGGAGKSSQPRRKGLKSKVWR